MPVTATHARQRGPDPDSDGSHMGRSGLVGIRGYLEEITLSDYLRAERAIYEAVVLRAPSLSVDDLMLTFQRLVESPTGLALQPATVTPALAAAQATVTLQVTKEDGEVKVIDLGAPPEDE